MSYKGIRYESSIVANRELSRNGVRGDRSASCAGQYGISPNRTSRDLADLQFGARCMMRGFSGTFQQWRANLDRGARVHG
jgi:hypothetical protein